MRIAVAVSGGVDSLCALLRLSRAGHDVLALHGLFLPDATADGPAPVISTRSGSKFFSTTVIVAVRSLS